MKLFILVLNSFLLMTSCHAQHAKRYYFIEFSTVYKSGLVMKTSDLFFLREKSGRDTFGLGDYCFALARQKVASYNDVLDTLAKTYELYSVNFSKDSLGTYAEGVFDRRSSYGREYLIKIDPVRNMGPVDALLIKVYTRGIENVDYKIIQSVCPYYKGDCTIEVRGVTLKHSR